MLNIGDKVILTQQGIDAWGGSVGDPDNPVGVVGIVVEKLDRWVFTDLVCWPTGKNNSYSEGDLERVVE